MNEINSPSTADARDWYYRMGERERGPLTLAQLKDLVASSGEVAREIVVRHGADGEWVPYQSIDGATARRLHADRSNRPASSSAAALADSPPPGDAVGTALPVIKRGPNLGRRLRANWPVVAGVLVWAGVNLILWNVLDPFRQNREPVLSDPDEGRPEGPRCASARRVRAGTDGGLGRRRDQADCRGSPKIGQCVGAGSAAPFVGRQGSPAETLLGTRKGTQ